MLSYSLLSLSAANNLSFFALNPIRVMTYGGAAFLVFSILWYLLWLLPIHAWFRKPIELSALCPNCGSKDVRSSHVCSGMDRFRKKLGLLPFRCRGCTRRFISRSSGAMPPGLSSQTEAG